MYMKIIKKNIHYKNNNQIIYRFIILVHAFCISSSLLSQNKIFYQEFNFLQRLSAKTNHSTLRPYNEQFNQLSFKDYYIDSSLNQSKLYGFIFKNSVLDIVDKDVHLQVDPLFNFSFGNQNSNGLYRYYTNTRGFRVLGDLGDKVSFGTRVYENQMNYPDYLDEVADLRGVAIGIGRSKPFKTYGHDAAIASGYVSFSPVKDANLQFGHGRHFFGNGYRSLLLSDYAPDYPYFSGQYKFLDGKIAYKHISAWMHSLERSLFSTITAEALFKQKATSLNMLSFNLNKQIEFSFFEGVVHKSYVDSIGKVNPDISFYLPIFGSSQLINKQESGINRVYGASLSTMFKDKLVLYGQTMFHDQSNWGFQSGLKWLNPLRSVNSYVLVEYNYVKPFSYTVDSSRTIQSYTHNGHELAHPLGSGFSELVLKTHVEYKKFLFNLQLSRIVKEHVINSDLGNNIFKPTYSTMPTTLVNEKIFYSYIELGYLLNVQTQMKLFVNFFNRKTEDSTERYFTFGFRTNLINNYFDQ